MRSGICIIAIAAAVFAIVSVGSVWGTDDASAGATHDGNIEWSISQDTLILGRWSGQASGEMKDYNTDVRPAWEGDAEWGSVKKVVIRGDVTAIGDYAFYNCGMLTSADLSEGLNSIGEHAFDNCTQISSIAIPSSVTFVDSYSFFRCACIEAITLQNVRIIQNSQFEDCISLRELTVGDAAEAIRHRAFASCQSLETVVIGDRVTKIAEEQFSNCTSLTELTLGRGLTTIMDSAFINCGKLTSVTFPDNVEHIEQSAFSYCVSLTSVTFGNRLRDIGDSAFLSCHKIASLVIPDSVISIGSHSFGFCTELGELTLPIHLDSVKDPAAQAFLGCGYVGKVTLTVGDGSGHDYTSDSYKFTPWYLNRNGCSLTISDGIRFIGDYTFAGFTFIALSIPDSVERIGDGAFFDCDSLETLVIPGSAQYIGDLAFASCGQLTDLTICYGVRSIGSEAFNGCDNARKLEIPDSVQFIGQYSFAGWRFLNELTIPISLNAVSSFEYPAFYGSCQIINKITFTAGDGYGCDYDRSEGIIFLDYWYEKTPWYMCGTASVITFGEGIVYIGKDAFHGCRNVGNVILPDSVKVIADNAFYGCRYAREVRIGDNVESIGEYAFGNFEQMVELTVPISLCLYEEGRKPVFTDTAQLQKLILTPGNGAGQDYGELRYQKTPWCQAGSTCRSVVFEDGIKSIGGFAFAKCGFREIELPDSITYVERHAFRNCASLESVKLSKNLTTIEEMSFNSCTSLRSVHVPENVEYIGVMAFSICSNLTEVTFSDGGSLETIREYAFSRCDKLQKAYLPYGVRIIEGNAFRDCPSLVELVMPDSLVSIGKDAFNRHTFYFGDTKLSNTAGDLRGYQYFGNDTGDMQRHMIVTFDVSNSQWGKLDKPGDMYVPYGTSISVNDDTLTIAGVPVHASPRPSPSGLTNSFVTWMGVPRDNIIKNSSMIYAVFKCTVDRVEFTVNDPEQGIVTRDVMTDVLYGSPVRIQGDTLDIGTESVCAIAHDPTAQYTFGFDSWTGVPADHSLRGSVTITANFTKTVNTYTVTFDVNNPEYGSVGRTKVLNIPYGTPVQTKTSLIKIGDEIVKAYPKDRTVKYIYRFTNWDAPATITGDTLIKANFNRVMNTYLVVFDSSGGTPVDYKRVEYGQKVPRPTPDPTKEGSVFDGWFFDGKLWDFDTQITAGITLVAHWHDEYLVTFDVQGHGTAPESQPVQKGAKVEKPADPSQPGFLFGGWFRESECLSAWDFDADTVQDSMTLYAKWAPAECYVLKGTQRTDYLTLEEGLAACSDGDTLTLLYSKVRDSFTIDKAVGIVFEGCTFYSESTALTIAADVTFKGMCQMPLTITFSTGACLTTDLEFDLLAKFDDPESEAGRVFARGLETDDVAVSNQGFSAFGNSRVLSLVKVTDYPYGVFRDGVFAFYASFDEAVAAIPEGSDYVYVLDYLPTYEGGTQVLSYTVDASVGRNITVFTVTRATDGTHSSFYVGGEEIYNNGRTVPIPAGKDLVAKLDGRIYISAGHVLSVADVSVLQDITLGGGRDTANTSGELAYVRLTGKAPATRISVGFENLDKWIERKQTEEGWIYVLKDGCDYVFITSDTLSLNDLVGVNASGFKANISPGGFSGRLVASASIVAYVRTSQESYTGYSSILDAVEQAKTPGQFDNTVYILYRTTDKEGDQPTLSHRIDVDLVFDGSFRFATVHQHVDSEGKRSAYVVDGSIQTLVFGDGRDLRITQDADLSKVFIEGTVLIEGQQTVDLGGSWGSDRTLVLDLTGHLAGTVVKNAGDVQYRVDGYPGEGYGISREGGDLVLMAPGPGPDPPGPDPPGPDPPGPEPSGDGLPLWTIVAFAVVILALTGVVFAARGKR